jgi:transketolase
MIMPTSPSTPTLDPKRLRLAADTVRLLAADTVQKANSGHPGMPMGMADAAVVLFTQFLRHDPADPSWPDRDRFVLSAGHGSALLYALLHLCGYDLPLLELQSFRQWGSRTPGHPEHGLTPGVETTTGPLGQGLANAVGMAIAERCLASRFNRPGLDLFDHDTYAIAGDGCMMEGISHEACALAGHLGLGRLIVLYDDNGISIDGPTSLSMSEDVVARFDAYGWHTQKVDGHDQAAVAAAIEAARAEAGRPSLIACRTHIGFGSPHRQDTSKAHGEPLGADELRLTKEKLGWPAEESFRIPAEASELMRRGTERGAQKRAAWNAALAGCEPERAKELRAAMAGELPEGWEKHLPTPSKDKPLATRSASGAVLDAIAPHLPSLIGGSADLTPSNNTMPKGAASLTRDDFQAHYVRFGVREHGMGGILNGLALHGGVRPYGGTFLVFSDYMRPSIRLAAMMGLPVIYVFTHDSIGLGEDGPTHQPIEHLAALRVIPNLVVLRPADATETVAAWKTALLRRDGPTALALTRQALPVLDRASFPDAAATAQGGYTLRDQPGARALILASGSEVHIALEAQDLLAADGVATRVVSMPSFELFEKQPLDYRNSVLPPAITARVAIEAGATLGWARYVGRDGAVIGLDRFGASAPYKELYRHLGLTAQAVVDAVRRQLG